MCRMKRHHVDMVFSLYNHVRRFCGVLVGMLHSRSLVFPRVDNGIHSIHQTARCNLLPFIVWIVTYLLANIVCPLENCYQITFYTNHGYCHAFLGKML